MKKHLLKSMLVMAMMAFGANAWAAVGDKTTNADIDFSNDISEGVVVGTVNQMTIGTGGAETIIQNGWLRLGDHANVVTINDYERAGARDAVTISFKMAFGNKNGMGSGFRVKDAEGNEIATYQHARWNGNPGNTLGIDMTDLMGGHSGNAAVAANATSYEIVFNYATKQIVSTLTLGGTTKEFTAELANTNPIASFEVFGYGAGANADRASIFDDLKITTTEGNYNVQSATYTVNFVYNDGIVETSERTGDVGDAISLLPADKGPRTIEGQKYFYVSDDAEGQTVAADGSTVITITLRAAEVWNYVFNATLDDTVLKAIGEGTVVEGESASVLWPRYVQYENKLAYKDAVSNSYATSFTPAANNDANNIAYQEFTGAENVVFFAEAEDIATLEAITDQYLPNRFSAGRGAYAKEDGSLITKVEQGKKYKLTARLMGTQSVATFKFRVGNRVIWEHATSSTSFYPGTDSYTEEFVAAKDANITLDAAGGDGSSGRVTNSVDYIYLEEVGAATEEEIATAAAADEVADGEAALQAVKDALAAKIAEAEALVDAEAVAVGLLQDAIDAAKAILNGEAATASELTAATSALQAAIDQFKADNADQEKDQTTKVGIAAANWTGASGLCATNFAPAITTYDGREAQLAEKYETTVATTGELIYQNITGLENGEYKVGFYANAFFTSGRGFDSEMADGAEDVAYVFANDQKEFITANIATSTTENNFRQFNVEVTDGTIKLGLGKEQPGTNWHTIQIYQLTWFTTAKAVYAADKADMAAAIDAAQALADDATKTEGKDDLNEAIATAQAALASNKLNLTEFEAAIEVLNVAVANFKNANKATFNGVYYVQHVATGKYLAGGHAWGTRGIVNETGLDLTLASDDNNNVTIDTRLSNGGNNHFLATGLFMDAAAYGWSIEKVGEDVYTIGDGTQYLTVDNNDELQLAAEGDQWKIIAADDLLAERLANLSAASEDNGVDATFLLKNPDFNRNDQRVSTWTVTFTEGSNSNLNGGADGTQYNGCAESYHAAFTVSQAIDSAPKGIYQLEAQGFYRQDDGVEEEAPFFFIGDTKADVPVKDGTENSMTEAGASFASGLYNISPIEYVFDGEGQLTVGITASAVHQWVIFDNFRLTYFGELTTGITNITGETILNGAVYNLQGQKVQQAKKGLYIINGKKVVK